MTQSDFIRISAIILCCCAWFSVSVEAAVITRGPYLQNQSPNEITVNWRTDVATDSKVNWGQQVNQQNLSLSNQLFTTEHQVTINNLQQAKKFYYTVGTTDEVLAGNDSNHFFWVPPSHGSKSPFRFWVLGDSGTANANAEAVRDAYLDYSINNTTSLWMMLGDNAYTSGTDEEYQNAVFAMYPDMLKQATLWPVIGNHDSANANSITATGTYYDIFTLPKQAYSSGHSTGVDSGTEAYYSFDYANVHFVMLESAQSASTFRQGMEMWLTDDLALSHADWIIAMWHHPPYTMGSHNSDTESKHIYMRENILPILEAKGVDLVLSGHSHSYERSWLIDSHYGYSGSFDSNIHVLDGTQGNPQKGGAYVKPSIGPTPHDGSVYVVAGSSGRTSNTEKTPHPALRNTLALKELGSLVIDVSGHNLMVRFLKSNGEIEDVFKIVKGDLIFTHSFEL